MDLLFILSLVALFYVSYKATDLALAAWDTRKGRALVREVRATLEELNRR